MKAIEERNINNPKEWVVPGTGIFIIPQAIVQSNDPTTANFTIRHGAYYVEGGQLKGIMTDFIENGSDDVGGFKTFQDVIEYLDRTATIEENIAKYVSMGMYEQAAEYFAKANKNNPLMRGRNEEAFSKAMLSKAEHTPVHVAENRAKAWRKAHQDCVDAVVRGVTRDPDLPTYGLSMH